MSQYYNPNRKASWNYGGEDWKLSRSKIGLFLECPRCFYVDNKLGTKRPQQFPFTLNNAVDLLLKREFDLYRSKNEQHPLQKQYKIDAKPVDHKELDVWRETFKGIQYFDKEIGIWITGAIDDLWINSKGEYIVVDYKATAKEEAVTELDKEWQGSYKKQIEVYQWLLRKKGLKVSDTAYFVYCTGKLDKESFDERIDFDVNLISYKGNDGWVEKTIEEIKECLESDKIPEIGKECDYCPYRESAGNKLKELFLKNSKKNG